MAEKLGEISVEIDADLKQLDKGLSSAERKADATSKKMDDSLKSVGQGFNLSNVEAGLAKLFAGIGALDQVGQALDRVLSVLQDIRTTGPLAFEETALAVSKAIPLIGTFVSAGERLESLLSGTATAAEATAEALKKVAAQRRAFAAASGARERRDTLTRGAGQQLRLSQADTPSEQAEVQAQVAAEKIREIFEKEREKLNKAARTARAGGLFFDVEFSMKAINEAEKAELGAINNIRAKRLNAIQEQEAAQEAALKKQVEAEAAAVERERAQFAKAADAEAKRRKQAADRERTRQRQIAGRTGTVETVIGSFTTPLNRTNRLLVDNNSKLDELVALVERISGAAA